MREYEFIQNKTIMPLIDYLTVQQDEYDFYAVDVHGVGFEWRIIQKDVESVADVVDHLIPLYNYKNGGK